jgi:hypothetical protein
MKKKKISVNSSDEIEKQSRLWINDEIKNKLKFDKNVKKKIKTKTLMVKI